MQIIFKVIKRRWYHNVFRFFGENHDGKKVARINNVEMFIKKDGKYYVDLSNAHIETAGEAIELIKG